MKFHFNLKTQLLFVASLMLLLPWAGCQSVSILETSLRQSHSQLLDVQMTAAAQQLQRKLNQSQYTNFNTNQGNYYAPLTDSKMLLDGFDGEESDWDNITTPWFQLNSYDYMPEHYRAENDLTEHDLIEPAFTEEPAISAKFKLAANDKLLYIFIQTSALKPHYYNPTQPQRPADQLNIRSINKTGLVSRWQINPQGSGRVEMDNTSQTMITSRDAGSWVWRDGHYTIEIALPINLASDAIGFDLILNDQQLNQHFKSKPSSTYERSLVRETLDLNQQLASYQQPGLSLYLLNSQYWLVGQLKAEQMLNAIDAQSDSGTGTGTESDNERKIESETNNDQVDPSWFSNAIYNKLFTSDSLPYWREPTSLGRWVSPQQLEQATWYQDSPINKQLHSKTMLVNGQAFYFVAVQDARQSLLSASKALNQLLILLFTIIAIIVSVLFTFASLLSWRIVKMKQNYRDAIDNDGKIMAVPEASKLPDELGDLSRVMQQLTANQGKYTDYLASLADKLSHELKTPVAVIRTSLENLELSNLDPEATKYLTRAMQGTNRLSQTLNALSEANKLEQSFEYAQWQVVPFDDMLEELTDAYRQIYSQHQFQLEYDQQDDYTINLAPELIVQLLDKLISNAVDYAPVDQPICFTLNKLDSQLQLLIENQGPHFSSDNIPQLFDSMVSNRQQSATPHLGLGLHIVKLISDFHQAKVSAENLPGEKGVIFELLLPIQ